MFFMHAKLNFVYLWVPKHNLEKDEVAYSKMGRERSFLNPFRRPMHVHDCWISMERSFFCTCTCNIYIYPLQCLRNPVISQEQENVLRNSYDDCNTGELYILPNWYANFAYLWEGVSIYISVSNYDNNECKMNVKWKRTW